MWEWLKYYWYAGPEHKTPPTRTLSLTYSLAPRSPNSLSLSLSLSSLFSSCKRDMQMGPIVVNVVTPPTNYLRFTRTHVRTPCVFLTRHQFWYFYVLTRSFKNFFFKTSLFLSSTFFLNPLLVFFIHPLLYTDTPIREVVIQPPPLLFPILEQCLTSFCICIIIHILTFVTSFHK